PSKFTLGTTFLHRLGFACTAVSQSTQIVSHNLISNKNMFQMMHTFDEKLNGNSLNLLPLKQIRKTVVADPQEVYSSSSISS
ncbi:hypothetical protein PFISCL1PPCAC_29074, partial [Pristionchus fissidentatus]